MLLHLVQACIPFEMIFNPWNLYWPSLSAGPQVVQSLVVAADLQDFITWPGSLQVMPLLMLVKVIDQPVITGSGLAGFVASSLAPGLGAVQMPALLPVDWYF